MINRISDFESGISSIQSQSLLSLSGIVTASMAYSFWKWGALILAILASFTAIIKRIKILIIKFQNDAPSFQEPLLRALDDGDESLEDASSLSSSSSDYYDEDEEEEEEVEDGELIEGSPVEERQRTYEIFRVKGTGSDFLESPWQSRNSSGLRRRGSIGNHFSEFASGKSVVKLWDNLGFGLGLKLDGDDLISWNHPNRARNTNPSPSSSSMSPSLILEKASAVSLGFWDARAASRRPAILAEWGPQIGKSDTVGRVGVGKVFLRSGGELAAVGDLRKVSAPLDTVTEADLETWWDADAVVVDGEFAGGGGSVGNGRSSAVTRCCDAVRSYLLF